MPKGGVSFERTAPNLFALRLTLSWALQSGWAEKTSSRRCCEIWDYGDSAPIGDIGLIDYCFSGRPGTKAIAIFLALMKPSNP